MTHIIKYPRTPHLEGSSLQEGDSKKERVLIKDLPEGNLVWEEKLDGANTGISFSEEGRLLLQSRGHFLNGGARERQFDILKSWSQVKSSILWDILGTRFIMYGEWLYAKHSIFYDALPHYFFEFDIYDKETEKFLSTPKRHAMLEGSSVISVPVVREGLPKNVKDIENTIAPSLYKTDNWREKLKQIATETGQDPDQVLKETYNSDYAEGIYFKLETDNHVIGRYKFVRSGFLQTILDSGTHWHDRPITPNQLTEGTDIFL